MHQPLAFHAAAVVQIGELVAENPEDEKGIVGRDHDRRSEGRAAEAGAVEVGLDEIRLRGERTAIGPQLAQEDALAARPRDGERAAGAARGVEAAEAVAGVRPGTPHDELVAGHSRAVDEPGEHLRSRRIEPGHGVAAAGEAHDLDGSRAPGGERERRAQRLARRVEALGEEGVGIAPGDDESSRSEGGEGGVLVVAERGGFDRLRVSRRLQAGADGGRGEEGDKGGEWGGG